MRMVPGNECQKVAQQIVDFLTKQDLSSVQEQIDQDVLDVEEVKKDLKAIMQAIVVLSKVTDTINTNIKTTISLLQGASKGVESGEGQPASPGN
jgi:hypothetical protein